MVYSIKDAADFDEQVKKAGDKIVVVKFFETWCGSCKMIAPVFEKLAEQYAANIVAVEVDSYELDDLSNKFEIEYLPTFVFLKNGEKIEQWTGSDSNQLEELIKPQIK